MLSASVTATLSFKKRQTIPLSDMQGEVCPVPLVKLSFKSHFLLNLLKAIETAIPAKGIEQARAVILKLLHLIIAVLCVPSLVHTGIIQQHHRHEGGGLLVASAL